MDAGIRCGWHNLELRQQLLDSLADRKKAATATSLQMSAGAPCPDHLGTSQARVVGPTQWLTNGCMVDCQFYTDWLLCKSD